MDFAQFTGKNVSLQVWTRRPLPDVKCLNGVVENLVLARGTTENPKEVPLFLKRTGSPVLYFCSDVFCPDSPFLVRFLLCEERGEQKCPGVEEKGHSPSSSSSPLFRVTGTRRSGPVSGNVRPSVSFEKVLTNGSPIDPCVSCTLVRGAKVKS